MGICEPLRIGERTLRKELGTYARLLVDIDFYRDMPKEILVQHERFEFIVEVEYENLAFVGNTVLLDSKRVNVNYTGIIREAMSS